MTKSEAMLCLMRIPYAEHISAVDLDIEPNAIRFNWRGDGFRLSLQNMMVEEVETPGILAGSNKAILMESIIKSCWIRLSLKETEVVLR